MITVKIIGGLGNQMFQYAAARALADRLGTGLRLDISAFRTYALHRFGLDLWKLDATSIGGGQMQGVPRLAQRIIARSKALRRLMHYHDEARDPPLTVVDDPNAYLEGYFQQAPLFSAIRPRLLREFQPCNDLQNAERELLCDIQSSNAVMLHVRRGDYISNPNNLAIHGLCSLDYYRQAMAQIDETVERPKYFVFSNDQDWVKQHLPIEADHVHVAGDPLRPDIDIVLMAACRHHIIANSSFSWWGAWLSGRPNVFAPEPWFASTTMTHPDPCPPDWIRLPR